MSVVPPPMSTTATPISFSSSQSTASALERLEDDVGDHEPAALGAADDVLDARGGGRDEVHLGAEADAAHPDGVADAVLRVDDVLAGEHVEDLAVGVHRDGARPLEDA